jgi:hypothetical protein
MAGNMVDRYFGIFLEKAGFEINGADFKSKEKKYAIPGKQDNALLESEIRGSKGFAGFIDGLCGRPNRFDSPIGTAKKKGPDKEGNLPFSNLKNILRQVNPMAAEVLEGAIDAREDDVVKSYDAGYKLGIANSTLAKL